MAKTPRSQCRAPGFDPWSGSEIPHAATKKEDPVCHNKGPVQPPKPPQKPNKPKKQLRKEMDEGCFMVRGNRKWGWGKSSFGELHFLTEFWSLIVKSVHLQGC